MTTGLAAEPIGDPDRLRAIEAPWWALFGRCPAATPFQSPAWLLAWWAAFAPGSLASVAVWRGETLVGLAPLYREAGGPRLLPLGIGVSDHLDLLIGPDRPGAVASCLFQALAAVPGWTELALDDLAPDAAALCATAPDTWHDARRPGAACPVLALAAGATTLADSLPSPKARKLRMSRHRAARRDAAIETADARSAAGFLDDLFRLHAARWDSRGEPGVLADPRVIALHRDALPGLLAHDLVRFYRLRIAGKTAGVHYGLRRAGRSYAYLGGFDPAFAFESPGTLLMGHAIEDALRAGERAFSFLRGRERYKYEWGAVDRLNTNRSLTRL